MGQIERSVIRGHHDVSDGDSLSEDPQIAEVRKP